MTDDRPADRASVLTPPGRGAVAVVAAEGAGAMAAVDAHFRAANGKPLAEQAVGRVAFGHWHADPAVGAPGEEVLVCRTDRRRCEVHCHGGVAAPRRILDALEAAGCEIQSWQAWLRADAGCPLGAEAEIALAAATTLRTAAILLDQRAGVLRREIERIAQDLAAGRLANAYVRLQSLRDAAPLGQRLTQPWHVAVAGRPNVGKSSLINRLVGYERAIVFDQPGTTRDVLAAETAFDGWPVRLTDAAGLRDSSDPLEAEGVNRARRQLAQADLVIWVLDALALSAADRAAPSVAAQREMAAEAPTLTGVLRPLIVVNKIDLVGPHAAPACDVLFTSAVTGAGVESLAAAIAGRLVPQPPPAGAPVPFTPRQGDLLAAASEAVRAGDAALSVTILDRLLQSGGA